MPKSGLLTMTQRSTRNSFGPFYNAMITRASLAALETEWAKKSFSKSTICYHTPDFLH
jgi:hypothetical protein